MNSEPKKIVAPLNDTVLKNLNAGDTVLLSGVIITGRDAAHKKMVDLISSGNDLPFSIKGEVIYYVGPTPAPPGRPIGAAGPTTSYRMDQYAPILIERGLKGMIGKGRRSEDGQRGYEKVGSSLLRSHRRHRRSYVALYKRGGNNRLGGVGTRSGS